MNAKAIIGIVALLAVVGAAAYYFMNGPSFQKTDPMDMSGMSPEEMANMPGNSSAVLAEDNAIMISDQRPGSTLTGTVYLAAPGYVVIHEDDGGQPGAVIGKSALLPAGENRDVRVTLTRAAREGEVLRALLHSEMDGNALFSAADAIVQSRLGGPIQAVFEISAGAGANPPISI